MPASPAPLSSASLSIRLAVPADLAWANARYAEVDFVPSGPDELIAIAAIDGAPAGLGRLVPLGPGVAELGGMLVFDAFKGHGLARRIIARLREIPEFGTLYCLPFAKLEGLYASMGFARIGDGPEVPPHVARKYRWCNEHYPEPVLLMRGQRAS